MGEVYRARDLRLQREVAVKILPSTDALDPERQRRFAQEAQAAGALNHPNVLAVYDVGVDGDTRYIVSELVEGTSLREEIERGRLPIRRLLDLAIQIAEGLAAAHDAGIVHRDLKPENVMVTSGGRVKILDFGIARVLEPAEAGAATRAGETQTGLLIGTVPYMSPEQARGARADLRSDQFALGSILYEMATGTQPFRRETSVQTLSAIIADEPRPIGELNAKVPLPVRWVIERCLAKEPSQRYAATSDLARELAIIRDHLAEVLDRETPRVAPQQGRRRALTRLGLVAGIALLTFLVGLGMEPPATDLSRYSFTPLATDAGYQGAPAWSPDGKNLAYAAEVDGVTQIFARSLASSLRNPVTRSRYDCRDPFWSPDGARIYFHAPAEDHEALWVVSAAGGTPEVVIPNAAGAAMSPDGRTLAFLRDDYEGGTIRLGLWFASPPEAAPQRFLKGDQLVKGFTYGVLRFSPDGSKLLLYAWWDEANETTRSWIMIRPASGEVSQVLPSLASPGTTPLFSWLPDSRHVVVTVRDNRSSGTHLWLADTDGNTAYPLALTAGNEGSPAVSADGRRIAFTSEGTDFDLALLAPDGSALRPLLNTTRNEIDPAWSPGGNQYAFVTDRTGRPEIWLRSSSSEGSWERPLVAQADFPEVETYTFGSLAFSPDGQRLAFQRFGSGSGRFSGYRVWIAPVAGGVPVRLSTDNAYEDGPAWSPDGAWIAYVRATPGRLELVKVPAGGNARPIVLYADEAAHFGAPQWAPDGRWISLDTSAGLMLVSPDGAQTRLLTTDAWIRHTWNADGSKIYGFRETDDLHHFMSASVDVSTGSERILNPNLGAIPLANQPIRGFTRAGNLGFATSIARVKSDIWLLEGAITPPRSLFDRVWRRLTSSRN